MARERHEGTRVSEHAYKTRKQPGIGKRIELPLDALFLIEKPPGAAKLDLAGLAALVKVGCHSGKGIVVTRIYVVQNDLGQGIFLVKTVQICTQCGRLRPVTHGIKSGIGTERLQTAHIGIAPRAQVQLLGPSFLTVKMAEE